jgi:hypothetical protein
MNEKRTANEISITLEATRGTEWICIHEGSDKMNFIRVTWEQFPRSGACVEVGPADVMAPAPSTEESGRNGRQQQVAPLCHSSRGTILSSILAAPCCYCKLHLCWLLFHINSFRTSAELPFMLVWILRDFPSLYRKNFRHQTFKQTTIASFQIHTQSHFTLCRSQSKLNLPPASAGFIITLVFNPEDGGDMFLRNVGLSPNYTPFKPRQAYSSLSSFSESQILRTRFTVYFAFKGAVCPHRAHAQMCSMLVAISRS